MDEVTDWNALCHELAAAVVRPHMTGLSEVLDKIIAADNAEDEEREE